MEQVSYCNLDTGEGLESYVKKAHANVKLFEKILGDRADVIGQMVNFHDTSANVELLKKIAQLTGLSELTVKGVNVADEVMNMNGINLFGCTSVGAGTKIGQTLDLFTLDLCVVREGGALYITMPPYLCLMGMGPHVSMVTNFLSGPVRPNGVPISHMRRSILRQDRASDVCERYLYHIERANTVNFLVADDRGDMFDIELGPDQKIIIHDSERVRPLTLPDGLPAGRPRQEGFLAHTNHFVQRNWTEDRVCPRLIRAIELLRQEKPLDEILEDSFIDHAPMEFTPDYGFGTIIKVIMDVKDKTFTYKDPFMSIWIQHTL